MNINLPKENFYVLENENFCVYAMPSLKNIADESFKHLNENKKRILDFFELKNFRKSQIIQFDNRDDFIKFALNTGYKYHPHLEYGRGIFLRGLIILMVDLKIIKNPIIEVPEYCVHEFVHIINREKIYNKRAAWIDEGIALNITNHLEFSELKNHDKFIEFIKNEILTIKELPTINDLEPYGIDFSNEAYNTYYLFYFSVRFLLESENKKRILEILKDYDLSIKIGKTVLQDAVQYYKNKYDL